MPVLRLIVRAVLTDVTTEMRRRQQLNIIEVKRSGPGASGATPLADEMLGLNFDKNYGNNVSIFVFVFCGNKQQIAMYF